MDGYVAAAVHPSEDPNRPGVRWLIRHFDAQTFDEIEMGPPLLKPAPKLVKQPARIEMIENEIAKLENPDHDRLSSWL